MEKRCRLMRSYGWKPDFVRKGITGAQGWVYYNWALENEANVWGAGVRVKGAGYVKQETERKLEYV